MTQTLKAKIAISKSYPGAANVLASAMNHGIQFSQDVDETALAEQFEAADSLGAEADIETLRWMRTKLSARVKHLDNCEAGNGFIAEAWRRERTDCRDAIARGIVAALYE